MSEPKEWSIVYGEPFPAPRWAAGCVELVRADKTATAFLSDPALADEVLHVLAEKGWTPKPHAPCLGKGCPWEPCMGRGWALNRIAQSPAEIVAQYRHEWEGEHEDERIWGEFKRSVGAEPSW